MGNSKQLLHLLLAVLLILQKEGQQGVIQSEESVRRDVSVLASAFINEGRVRG